MNELDFGIGVPAGRFPVVGRKGALHIIVTPTVFATHAHDAAGKIVGAIMPHYFRYGLILKREVVTEFRTVM